MDGDCRLMERRATHEALELRRPGQRSHRMRERGLPGDRCADAWPWKVRRGCAALHGLWGALSYMDETCVSSPDGCAVLVTCAVAHALGDPIMHMRPRHEGPAGGGAREAA